MSIPTHKLKTLASALLLSSFFGQPLAALAATDEADATDDTPNWQETTLTGDWGGARKRLYDSGVQVDLMYTADYLRNNAGGLQHGGAYMGHTDLVL
ncbi:MAG: carbohydrate porin, partial [Candidatus Accumulibacter sp.]|nr:carbohydrate porin [Accumulibacter sp.]